MRPRATQLGANTGDFAALLRGEIEPAEYVDRVKVAVDARLAMQEHRRGRPIAFSWPTRRPGGKP